MLKVISPTINQDLPFPRPIKNELECKYRVDKLLPATACLSSHGPYGCSVTLITDQINILSCNRHPHKLFYNNCLFVPLFCCCHPQFTKSILEQSRRCNKLRINHHPTPGRMGWLAGNPYYPINIAFNWISDSGIPMFAHDLFHRIRKRVHEQSTPCPYSHLPNNNNAHPTPKYDGN